VYSHFKPAQTNWTASHQTYLVLHLSPDCVSFLCGCNSLSAYPSTFGLWARLRGMTVRFLVGHPAELWGPCSLLQIGYRATISPGVKQSGRDAHIHLHLVPKLRMYGGIPLLPYPSSWHRDNFTPRSVLLEKLPVAQIFLTFYGTERLVTIRFPAFTAAYIGTVFWDVVPCSLVKLH
jgi:hypothetical protein